MKQERNAKCACGSGIKYKKCCLITEREKARQAEIEWREGMQRRAEGECHKRELALDYRKAVPSNASLRGMFHMIASLALAASVDSSQHRAKATFPKP